MSDKSYVALEQAVCPVCGVKHDTGVLLHRRLKPVKDHGMKVLIRKMKEPR